MNRPLFALIVAAIVIIVLLAMWFGWRARTRRDASVTSSSEAPSGTLLEAFSRVFYVSTTPVGEPLSRVAVSGLRYRGRAEVSIFEDGMTIEVDGERAVHLASTQLCGSGVAARRIGKAVEQGGLALVRWVSEAGDLPDYELESSFRFNSGDEQARFTAAVDRISLNTLTSEEGAE